MYQYNNITTKKMDKTKIYDIRIKIQQEPNGRVHFKPSYLRFLIKSNDINKAKEKALSVFSGEDIEKLKFTIIKTTLMKIDGMFDA